MKVNEASAPLEEIEVVEVMEQMETVAVVEGGKLQQQWK